MYKYIGTSKQLEKLGFVFDGVAWYSPTEQTKKASAYVVIDEKTKKVIAHVDNEDARENVLFYEYNDALQSNMYTEEQYKSLQLYESFVFEPLIELALKGLLVKIKDNVEEGE